MSQQRFVGWAGGLYLAIHHGFVSSLAGKATYQSHDTAASAADYDDISQQYERMPAF